MNLNNSTTPGRFRRNSRVLGVLALATTIAVLGACGEMTETANEAPAVEAPAAASATGKMDVNTATEAEMETVPGVTEEAVHEIMEHRPFDNIEEFREEMGEYFDAATVATFEQHLTVGG